MEIVTNFHRAPVTATALPFVLFAEFRGRYVAAVRSLLGLVVANVGAIAFGIFRTVSALVFSFPVPIGAGILPVPFMPVFRLPIFRVFFSPSLAALLYEFGICLAIGKAVLGAARLTVRAQAVLLLFVALKVIGGCSQYTAAFGTGLGLSGHDILANVTRLFEYRQVVRDDHFSGATLAYTLNYNTGIS